MSHLNGFRVAAASAALLVAAVAAAAPVAPGQGVRLAQQSHANDTATVSPNTGIGSVMVNMVQLRQSTGLPSGYLNIATQAGWVVRNLPVPAEDVLPYGEIAADFALGNAEGTAVTALDASIDFSASLQSSYSGPMQSHPVEAQTIAVGGGGPTPVTAAPTPPNLTDILINGPKPGDEVVTQFDHPNIEAAYNACMPTAVANSLQYLKDTAGLAVPHEHKMGLRPSVSPGDDSLVGQVEEAMNRPVTDRRHGTGTYGLQGKLKYLAQNNLNARVSVRHWGDLGPDKGSSNVSVQGGTATASSTGSGKNIDFDAVLAAMKEGQNCEAVYQWPTGAHAVDLVAIGKSGGQPWIVHASDLNQNSDSRGAGPSGLKFEYLTDPDKNGKYNLSGGPKEIVQVICEKYVPPPSSVQVVEKIDPANHSCCVSQPPKTMTMTVSPGGDLLSVAGSGASWLPLNGRIDPAGNFDVSGSATVAGFPNVKSRFTGTYDGSQYTGTLVIGTQGELHGVPLTFRLQITEPATAAIPAVRANGFRHAHRVRQDEPLKLSVSMRPAALTGRNGEWWMFATTDAGQAFSFDLATMGWKPGMAPVLTGPAANLRYFGLPTLQGLPAGTYGVTFGFDTTVNGSYDSATAVAETLTLTVEP